MDTQEFLNLFRGSHFFAAIPDKKEDKTRLPAKPSKTATSRLQLSQLQGLNNNRYGIYFAVNTVRGNRRLGKNIIKIRAIWVDDDIPRKKPRTNKFPIKPSIILQTSQIGNKFKHHYYWLTSTKDFEAFKQVMKTMVNVHGNDPGVIDLPRVLRLPGYNHHKGEPFLVKVVGGNKRKYPWSMITTAFPPSEDQEIATSDKDGKFSISKCIDIISHAKEGMHGSMVSIALSYANRNMKIDEYIAYIRPFEELAAQHGDAKRIEHRFSEAHLKECWGNADEIVSDDRVKLAKLPRMNLKSKSHQSAPLFPVDFCKNWPEPWPRMWEEWKRVPIFLDECLLATTFIAAHAHLLNGNYINVHGRVPCLGFLAIAKSGRGKDDNTTDTLQKIYLQIKKKYMNSQFKRLTQNVGSMTADTSFMKSVDKQGNMFWAFTEATKLFEQLSQKGNSSPSIGALSDSLIHAMDGRCIVGKNYTDENKKVPNIDMPNVQLVFCAQPETLRKYITKRTIDSGLGGRLLPHFMDDTPRDDKYKYLYRIPENSCIPISDWLVDFYGKMSEKSKGGETEILAIRDKDLSKIEDHIIPLCEKLEVASADDDAAEKFLLRMGMAGEYLYVTVLGVCREWDKFNEKKMRESINPSCLLEINEYWANSKMHLIREFVGDEIDPVASSVMIILRSGIEGSLPIGNGGHARMIKKHHGMTHTMILAVLKTGRFKQIVENVIDLSVAVQRSLRLLCTEGDIIEFTPEKTRSKYYGF